MINIRKSSSLLFVFAAAALLLVAGCGKGENTVVQPGELTPAQQAEMDQLGDQMKESMSGKADL